MVGKGLKWDKDQEDGSSVHSWRLTLSENQKSLLTKVGGVKSDY